MHNRVLHVALTHVALLLPLVGQSPTSSWVATTAMTATAVSQTNSLPIGTNLAAGQSVQANETGFPPFGGGFFSVSASSVFSAATIAGGQTFQIAQNVSIAGTVFASGSTAGTSTITLTSAAAIWARLTVTYTGTATGGGPLTPTASIDVGADGSVEWTATQPSTWQVIVPIQGTVNFRVSASVGPLAVASRNLLMRFDYYAAQAGAGSPVAAGIPSIGPVGGAAAIGNASFGIGGTGFLPNGLAIVALKVGSLLPPPGVQIPGAQPGCAIYVGLPEDLLAAAIADPNGASSYAVPIPNNNTLVGVTLGAQWFAWDPALAFQLPIGSTPALSVRLVD